MMEESKGCFLAGEAVYLRPRIKEDAPYLWRMFNEESLRYLIGGTRPSNMKDIETSIDNPREDAIWFSIIRKEDDQTIGETGLLRMFPEWGTTDLSIIIPDEVDRGMGYGTDAIILMLKYAFGYMNFNRVAIGVVGFNHKALRFYEKIGFIKEGIQEQGYYHNFEYSDFVMMRILKHEYVAKAYGAANQVKVSVLDDCIVNRSEVFPAVAPDPATGETPKPPPKAK